MTTPKGKILLAKLPKDIVQFCIEPMLMITKGEVEKNYQNLLCHFKGMDIDQYYRGVSETGDSLPRDLWIPLREYVNGCRDWRYRFFDAERSWREWRKEVAARKRKSAEIDRLHRLLRISLCVTLTCIIAKMLYAGVYVSSRSN